MTLAMNRVRRVRAFGPALALGLSLALAPEAGAQTLADALSMAYTTNPTLAAARAELRAVNERVPQALSNWRPSVTLTGSAGKQRIESESTFSTVKQTTSPTEVRLSVIQPIFRGGRTLADTQRSKLEVRAQRATLRSVEQDVLLRAATSYMDVWRDQAVLKLNINNEKVLERQLEASKDRFTVGEVTRTDVAQSETRLAVATAGRISAEGDLSSSKAVYEEIIGAGPGQLQAPPPLAELPGTVDLSVEQAIGQNPSVLAANFTEQAAQKQVRSVIGELLPSVRLNGTLRHAEETSQKTQESDQAQILAEITVPLYQQGLVYSRVREVKQISSQRRIQVEEARRRAVQEAISAWEALHTARAQIRSFETGVRSAEIALDGVTQENAVGARTVLDILDAEQELLDSKVNLVRSQRDEVVAGFALLTATGRLNAREAGLAVEIYDPEIDYNKVKGKWIGIGAPGQ